MSAVRNSTSESRKANVVKDTLLTDPVSKELYFYGLLPREDVEMMLLHDGEFLVRQTRKVCPDASGGVISVRWKEEIVHVVILKHERGYVLENCPFATVKELVEYYKKKKIPVTQDSGAILIMPVHRANWVLHDNQLRLIEKIGEGEFGEVWKAELTPDNGKNQMVAVKRLKSENVPKNEQKLFFDECRHLRQLRHAHIVNFKGVSLDSSIKLVMELCDIPLLSYLHRNGPKPTFEEHLKLITHASRGMAYLSSQKIIHRDVAARNCLLKSDNLKIADFGMARTGDLYKMTPTQKPLPVKWIPPDTLVTRKFTEKSDVWSFGVMAWEVLTNGSLPYMDLVQSCKGPFVIELLKFLKKGGRLVPPSGTPKELTTLLNNCWNNDPEKRPKFCDINRQLEAMYTPTQAMRMQVVALLTRSLVTFSPRTLLVLPFRHLEA